MDVERIQKINSLAVDLMKQGLAEDREEAIKQAENVFRSEEADGYSEVKKATELQTPNSEETQSEPEISQNKIKEILQKNTEFIVKTIKEFQEKIHQLEKEVAHVKNNTQGIPTVKDLLDEAQRQKQEQATSRIEESAPVQAQPVVQQAQHKTEQAQTTESHPRSGNYKDNDVSIEKFFYMGNK